MRFFKNVFVHTEYEGYFLPKGAVVYPNLYEAHHDVEFWEDPENFRPE
jgi:cytochrome P450